VTKELSQSSFLFKINGLVHGRDPVFTDGIFYIFKGGKLLNCCLQQINDSLEDCHKEAMMHGRKNWLRTSFTVRATGLPKSFGCEVRLDSGAVNRNKHRLDQLRAEFRRKAYDQLSLHSQEKPLMPMKISMLNDFGARVSKAYFVFNINDDLIKDQTFSWRESLPKQSLDILLNQDQPEG
jgi:hypothetical protein